MTEAGTPESRRTFTAEERRRIVEAGATRPIDCPRCGHPLVAQDVRIDPSVSYVRRRQMWSCAGCGASTAIDRPR